MKQNVGKADKVIRVVIGITGLLLGWYISPWFYILAAVGLLTAMSGYCLFYSILKVNTCKGGKGK